MEFKGTKGEWHTSFSEVKKNEHSRKFITIYSQTVANSVIAVAYSKNNIDTEVKANAKIIAAAPEMFEMLKDLTEIVDGYLREQANNDSYPNYIIERNEKVKQLLTKITEK